MRKIEFESPESSPVKPKQNQEISSQLEKKKLTEEILTWVKTDDSVQIYTRLVESIRSDITEKTQKQSPPRNQKTEEVIAFLKSIQLESLAPTLINTLGADSMDSLRFLKESDLSKFLYRQKINACRGCKTSTSEETSSRDSASL